MDHARPTPIPLRILGTGEYVPSRCISSAEFDQRWHKPEGWTRRHVGIDHRYFAGPDETGSLMAAHPGVLGGAGFGEGLVIVDDVLYAQNQDGSIGAFRLRQ